MRTLLVDDEVHNCELIETLLHYHMPGEIEVVAHAYSVDQAAEIIRNQHIELLFLDIQMPGKNGFELLQLFPQPEFELIFITSFDNYALPAIKADAIAYLLKPVDVQELKRAVAKALKIRLLRTITNEGLPVAQPTLTIPVHDGGNVIYLNIDDIVWFAAEGRYTRITLSMKQDYLVPKNLKTIEDALGADSSFLRINRSVILNIAFVREYSKSEPFSLILKNGDSFDVSRRKRKEILMKLKSGRIC